MSDNKKLAEVYKDDFCTVYRNRNCMPRAFLAPRVKIIPPGNSKALSELSNHLLDLRTNAVVESQKHTEDLKLLSMTAIEEFSGDISVISYHPSRIEIDVISSHPSLLVLTDTYYPGWRAYVDGSESEILKTDLLFRGVLNETSFSCR